MLCDALSSDNIKVLLVRPSQLFDHAIGAPALALRKGSCMRLNKAGRGNRRRVFADLSQFLSPVGVSSATTVATVGGAASAPGKGGAE